MLTTTTALLIDPLKVAKQWPDFSELELTYICKNVHTLRGGLQAKYGISADEAARQVIRYYRKITAP